MNLSMFFREVERIRAFETPFDELCAGYNVIQELKKEILGQPCDVKEAYEKWLKQRLKREREKYIARGNPIPPNLKAYLDEGEESGETSI